jgi:hypothetical protein
MRFNEGLDDRTAIAMTMLTGIAGTALVAIVLTLMAAAIWGGGIF